MKPWWETVMLVFFLLWVAFIGWLVWQFKKEDKKKK